MYSREVVAEVLAASDIVDVIGARVELKPAGSGRLKGLCPFHNEKTPSFTVNRTRQAYHCFGCGKGGDAIAFIMEHEGQSFVEALRQLADRGGVHLPAVTEGGDAQEYLRTQLLDFNKAAAAYFRRVYEHPERGKPGRAYVAKRQLNDSMVQRFGLGYAPDGFHNLAEAARRQGTHDRVLEASGLAKRGERGGLYDAFRNRLIFPILDASGRTVAFGGRDLSGENPAKYINSPETAVYRKSRVLYGLYEARDALRREGFAILVEGYLDLIRCFEAGIENVVATCGTALTKEQALLIKRYVPEIVLVYDGDAAGIQAALKGTGVLAGAGLRVRATALPEGQDPDDFVRAEGGDALRGRVRDAKDFIQFHAEMNAERLDTMEGPSEVARELFAAFQAMSDQLVVDEYLKRTAEALRLQEWSCRREYQRFCDDAARRTFRPREESPKKTVPVNKDDCDFVSALLEDETLLQQTRGELKDIALPEGPLSLVLRAVLEDTGPAYFEDERAAALYAAAAAGEAAGMAERGVIVEHQVRRLKKASWRARAQRLQQDIAEAELKRDTPRATELLRERVELLRRIEQAGAH